MATHETTVYRYSSPCLTFVLCWPGIVFTRGPWWTSPTLTWPGQCWVNGSECPLEWLRLACRSSLIQTASAPAPGVGVECLNLNTHGTISFMAVTKPRNKDQRAVRIWFWRQTTQKWCPERYVKFHVNIGSSSGLFPQKGEAGVIKTTGVQGLILGRHLTRHWLAGVSSHLPLAGGGGVSDAPD